MVSFSLNVFPQLTCCCENVAALARLAILGRPTRQLYPPVPCHRPYPAAAESRSTRSGQPYATHPTLKHQRLARRGFRRPSGVYEKHRG